MLGGKKKIAKGPEFCHVDFVAVFFAGLLFAFKK